MFIWHLRAWEKKYYSITSDHFIKFPSLISITSLCLVYNNSVVKPHQKIMWIWLKYKPLYYAVARNIKVCALVKMKKTIFSRKIGRDNKLHWQSIPIWLFWWFWTRFEYPFDKNNWGLFKGNHSLSFTYLYHKYLLLNTSSHLLLYWEDN